uniref:Capsid n=1 Tax=Macaque picobirnavirus 1 TaxID=2078789 RepID=A0A2L1FE48_9VIRU|nr:capsid [Macaque picobirnavirus 1]
MRNENKEKSNETSREGFYNKATSEKSNSKRSRQTSKSKRNSAKPSSRFCDTGSNKVGNDPNWYNNNDQLLKDAASFSYFYPAGSKIDLQRTTTELTNILAGINDMGVMACATLDAPGCATDQYSPVNVAARQIYTWVRHANSGHTNYDAPDLMLYILSMDSAYAMYAYMVRAYGCLQLFSQVNRYYPKGIMEAFSLDYDDFIANLADFRYFINSYAYKLASLAVPASIPFFTRHVWMYSNTWLDDISAKAQLYVYTPYGFHVFDEFNATGGKLTFRKWHNSIDTSTGKLALHKFADLKAMANSILDAVLASEDMNIMSGDILKAFGTDGVLKVAPVSEDYVVFPQYSAEVISQIKNATFVGSDFVDGSLDITQNAGIGNGAILFQPKFTIEAEAVPIDTDKRVIQAQLLNTRRLISMWRDDITPDDTMVATRLTVVPETTTNGGISICKLSCFGSELAITHRECGFGTLPGDNTWQTAWTRDYGYAVAIEGDVSNAAKVIEMTTQIAQVTSSQYFKDQPAKVVAQRIMNSADELMKWTVTMFMFDLNNYGILDYQDLQKLHETALLSEFHCPLIGRYSPTK